MARWTYVDKIRTLDFAYCLRMWKSGFGLLTYCMDDPKVAAVCHLGFIWRILGHSWRVPGGLYRCAKFS